MVDWYVNIPVSWILQNRKHPNLPQIIANQRAPTVPGHIYSSAVLDGFHPSRRKGLYPTVMFKHPFLATFFHDTPLSLTARFIGGEERRNLLAWTRMRGAIPHSTNETWNIYIYIYI